MRFPVGRRFGGTVRPPWPFGINTNSPQARGLVAWWPCVETGALLRDLSLGSVDLTRTGASWVAAPQAGVMAPDCNGTSDVFTRDDSPISDMPFTMAVWAIGDDFSSGRALFSLSHATLTDRYQLIVDSVVPGRISAQIVQGASSDTSAATTDTTAVGDLFHAVAVYEYSGARAVYLNGKDKHQSAITIAPNPCTQLTVAAKRNAGTTGTFFDGRIVEARLYNRALTDEEVWDLYAPQTRWQLYRPLRAMVEWFEPIPPRRFLLCR